jgi:GST-like protein
MAADIDLYTWNTPNGYKVSIALEELELAYRVVPVDINRGEQFAPDFLRVSPNNKIPAIVDNAPAGGGAPIAIFESAAILLYLAEKTGRLVPRDLRGRVAATEWLAFQVANVGPMMGQLNHFNKYAHEQIPYAIDRYSNEVCRVYHVVDKRLGEVEYLAGEYSIADIACFAWMRRPPVAVAIAEYPNAARWIDAIAARPAVQRGVLVPPRKSDAAPLSRAAPLDATARENLFGKKQYERR